MFLHEGMTLADRYVILRALGSGGMGAAHLVEDQRLNRRCVIKEMHSLDAARQSQFEREAQLLASLRHPNLPEVYSYFIYQEHPFIVMEYVEGQTLDQLQAQRSKPFDIPDVLHWAQGLLAALRYMHEHRPPVIHRDIKPQNVCVTPKNEAVLLDFGIARPLDDTRTRTSAQAWSHNYAPIEQYRVDGLRHIPSAQRYLKGLRGEGYRTGPYTDIYGVSATLYFALTQLPPPDAAMRVLEDELRPPQEINPQVPDFVADAIMRALRIHPGDRFQSAAEMLNALKTPGDNDSSVESRTQAAPEGLLWTVIGALRQHVLALGIGTCLVLLVLTGALILFGPGKGKTNQPLGTKTATLALVADLTESPTITFKPTDIAIPTTTPRPPPTAAPASTTTSTLTATPLPTPCSFDFAANAEQLNIYAAPGENYAVLGMVRRGDRLLVIGRLDDGTWWQVDFFGFEGWIPAQPVGIEVNPADLPPVVPPVLATITPTPTPTRTPTPTPECAILPLGEFDAVWREELTRAHLGCPFEQEHLTGSARAAFQNGFMYWREDRLLIYVFYNDGRWQEFEDTWQSPQPDSQGYTPPPGLMEPIRGFGKVWREQLEGPEAAIGWATEHEIGGDTLIEDFERGVILKIDSTVYLLYRDGMTWQPYSPGIGIPAKPPPSSRQIVFVSDRDGNREIYVMNPDGSDQRRLTHHPSEDDLPAVSPDGHQIAFQSQRDGNWEVYTMNLEGGNLQRVTDDPSTDRLPNWSPDGQWLIFGSDRDGDFDLYVIRPDGTGLRQLTDDAWHDGHVSWSQNGLIALNSDRDDYTTEEIFTIKADGSDRRQLTHNTVNDWSPNWSPDGRTIIFLSRRAGDPDIYLMDADGGNPRLLHDSPDYEWGAVFSPDGQWIAFTSDQSGDYQVYAMQADGGGVVRLTDQGGWYPSWVP